MKSRLIVFVIVLFSISINANAIQLQVDKDLWVEKGQFNEDFLFLGNHLQFEGGARDLFFMGERMDYSGDLALGLFGFGESVNVHGSAGNGLKIGARAIAIQGQIEGTSFLGGQTVEWGADSRTIGDTFIGAKTAILKGKMQGDLYVGAGSVFIENEIRGNVRVYAGEIEFGDQGRIIGNMIYTSDQQLTEEDAARVSGEVRFEEKENGFFWDRHDHDSEHDGTWFWPLLKLAMAVFGLILLLIPATKALEKRTSRGEILSYAIWGLIPIFMYPTIILFSILLVITLPLALSMVLAFLPLLLISKTIGITLIGGTLAERININSTNRFLYFLLGVIPYSLLSLIPFFGILLMVFVSSIGCGVLLSLLLNRQNDKTSGYRAR